MNVGIHTNIKILFKEIYNFLLLPVVEESIPSLMEDLELVRVD